SPTLTTTPGPNAVTLGTSPVTLTDAATLAGGYYPTGTITFRLVSPSGATLDTETVPVNGNGTYTTPAGFTLPASAAAGTYQWNATYSGGPNNNAATDLNDVTEQVTVSPAPQADIALTKTVTPSVVEVGMDVTYTFVIRDLGPDTATGVVVN